jgi:hypothetical protein
MAKMADEAAHCAASFHAGKEQVGATAREDPG